MDKISGIHYKTGNPVILEIVDGIIVSIVETDRTENNDLYLAPGLIDNQVNGYAGVDFSDDHLTSSGLLKATKALHRAGITTYLPTLLTNSHEKLLRNFMVLDEAVRHGKELRDSICGFHLEGPYISAEEGFRGCHPLRHIRKPSWREFGEYQDAAGGRIKEITLAPETEGAYEFIKLCSQSGVVVAIGHTNATNAQISHAADAGARLSTHLGNGCANMIHRHNNPIWPQLADNRFTPSIIADGHHLLPEEIQVFFKVKGKANLILTSDVIYLAGMAPGKYIFLESEVLLTNEGMLVNPAMNCLAGASFPLVKGVGNFMAYTGCSLAEAIDLASVNVARVLDLTDRGRLIPGARADIIRFKRAGNEIEIKETIVKGNVVFG